MPSKKLTAEKRAEIARKRSRPVTRQSSFKRYGFLLPLLVIIIAVSAVAAVVIINPFKTNDLTTSLNGNTDEEGNPIAVFNTSMGTFKAEIYEDLVPITAGNFIDHVNDGYYDGIIFHRVISDFMIQGGDPTGTGYGGHAARYHEGYGAENDPNTWVIPDEFHPLLKHNSAGILSMANSGANTGGSQFFITVKETSWLDGAHAVFGKITEGIDVVNAISEVNTDSNDKPTTDVVINSIDIES